MNKKQILNQDEQQVAESNFTPKDKFVRISTEYCEILVGSGFSKDSLSDIITKADKLACKYTRRVKRQEVYRGQIR